MSGLRVAVPKGAIFEDALAALGGAGLPVKVLRVMRTESHCFAEAQITASGRRRR